MNRQEYIAEVERQLKDKKYYTELSENPCERFKQEIQTKISTIEDSEWLNNISDINIPSENRILQFYILPKIHKTHDPTLPLGYPGRPIVSACGSLTENISTFLDKALKTHMESLPSYIKDTTDSINKIRHLPLLPKDSYLVTLDVTSLYNNIPHKEGIEACQYFK